MFSLKAAALSFAALLPLARLAAGQASEWGQCGGIGWTGATTCGMHELARPIDREIGALTRIPCPRPCSVGHRLHRDQRVLLPLPAWAGHAPAHPDRTLHVCSSGDDVDADGQHTWGSELDPRVDALSDLQLRLEPEQRRHVRVQAQKRRGPAALDRHQPLWV